MISAETMIRAVPLTADRTGGVIELDAVENPLVRAGVAYWRQIRGKRHHPARSDISPRAIAPLLRNTVLVRAGENNDHEFRIVGDAHVIAHGFSMQGHRLSQVEQYAPGYGTVLHQVYDPVIERHIGFALRGWLLRGEKEKQYLHTEAVFLPLGPDDATVDHVLNFSVYEHRDGKE